MSDESPLEFPCDFPIKMMGRQSDEFRAVARALVEKHTGPLDDSAIQSALSRNGRFVSITVTVRAQSRQQLDAIYREVTAHDDVLMALQNAVRINVRNLSLTDYEPVWRAMQAFTDARDETTDDEIWFTEHRPVFTLGLNASREHLLAPGDIPVVQIDRGGQVTYHGPGQLMIYPLVDLRRAGVGVRPLVTALEQSVVRLAADDGIIAASRPDAPGVYVDGAKLASVGLRIRRGASFHGMCLNVDADLQPFSRINPCGFENLAVTDLARLGAAHDMERVRSRLLAHFLAALGHADATVTEAAGELPAVS